MAMAWARGPVWEMGLRAWCGPPELAPTVCTCRGGRHVMIGGARASGGARLPPSSFRLEISWTRGWSADVKR